MLYTGNAQLANDPRLSRLSEWLDPPLSYLHRFQFQTLSVSAAGLFFSPSLQRFNCVGSPSRSVHLFTCFELMYNDYTLAQFGTAVWQMFGLRLGQMLGLERRWSRKRLHYLRFLLTEHCVSVSVRSLSLGRYSCLEFTFWRGFRQTALDSAIGRFQKVPIPLPFVGSGLLYDYNYYITLDCLSRICMHHIDFGWANPSHGRLVWCQSFLYSSSIVGRRMAEAKSQPTRG